MKHDATHGLPITNGYSGMEGSITVHCGRCRGNKTAGYYDDLAVLHRSIGIALDRRDQLQATLAQLQRRIDDGMLALRASRREATTPTHGAWGPADLAQALGCTRQHIHNLIARGELRSVKLGRKRLIPADVVAELLARKDGPSHA